jgi:hypothetical protein
MNTTVEVLRHGMVNVIRTPSLLRRVLFRESETQRIAVCWASSKGWRWVWDDDSTSVDAATVKLIDHELIEHRRAALGLAAASGNVRFLVVEPSRPPSEPPPSS